jgi:dipeptidyl-peptidase-4
MNRGRDFKHSTYMNLGKLETEDFIDFAEYLGRQTYVDKARIGIQGWSYGGYMTSLCMTKGADVYSAGIAVAPVTNWKYYDSIFSDQFCRSNEGRFFIGAWFGRRQCALSKHYGHDLCFGESQQTV